MTTSALVSDLKRDEGYETHAYADTLGNLTIGVGHLLPKGTSPDLTWTDEQIETALSNDIAIAERDLTTNLPWWRTLDDVRQDVLCEMCFNMGIGGLMGFHDMLAACKAGSFEYASLAMLDSQWAVQVKGRAQRLADMMRTGERAA